MNPDNLWSAIDDMGFDALKAAFRGEHLGKACRRCAEGTRHSANGPHHPARQAGTRPCTCGRTRRPGMFGKWPMLSWIATVGIQGSSGRDVRQDEILSRLTDATFGPELSRMVAGALNDTGQVEGKGKAESRPQRDKSNREGVQRKQGNPQRDACHNRHHGARKQLEI